MDRVAGPFFEAAGAPPPPPPQQQAFFHPPPPPLPPPAPPSSSSEICEHETSIDLSAYLDPGAFHDEFLAELLFQQQQHQRGSHHFHPQPTYPPAPCKEPSSSSHYGFHGGYAMPAVRVKQEPHEEEEEEETEPLYTQAARCAQTAVLLLQQPTPPPTPTPVPAHPPPPPHTRPGAKKSGSSSSVDKGSREYRLRRERNNVAVRKSRDKAKLRNAETQQKVLELSGDNERLRKRVEQLARELQALRGLLRQLPPGAAQHLLAATAAPPGGAGGDGRP